SEDGLSIGIGRLEAEWQVVKLAFAAVLPTTNSRSPLIGCSGAVHPPWRQKNKKNEGFYPTFSL
ncbi:MAG: hypothetical protein ACREL1_08900, partial [bacterium]